MGHTIGGQMTLRSMFGNDVRSWNGDKNIGHLHSTHGQCIQDNAGILVLSGYHNDAQNFSHDCNPRGCEG